MIGVILGAVGGALQFLLLKKLADAVTSNKDINTKTILLVFAQIPVPVCILLVCALWLRSQLLYCGIGMAFVLIALAVITFVVRMRRKSQK